MGEKSVISRTGTDREKDPDEIKADIERTRAEMSETVEAIQEKLSPEHLRGRIRYRVREAAIGRARNMANRAGDRALGIGANIMNTVKNNPVPAAMAGLGLGWLIMKRPQDSGDGHFAAGRTSQVRGKAEEIAGRTRESISETISSAQERAGQISGQVKSKAGEMKGAARERTEQARNRITDFFRDNPLAAGALVLVIGAIAGLSIPATRKEEELMGEAGKRGVGSR